MNLSFERLVADAVRAGASDLHLTVGNPPALRVNGAIQLMAHPALAEAPLGAAMDAILTPAQRQVFQDTRRLCFTWRHPELGYFRVNIYSHMGRMEAAVRINAMRLPSLPELGVPELMAELMHQPQGLVLITGATGQGKTTTMHALLARVHAEQRKKIITIEDPVEFRHGEGRSVVVQQEIGLDTDRFHAAVAHALRQDPDILCIGEMIDLDTISAALTAAETGHLVLATLHTTGAAGTISRIVDVFPPHQQEQVRLQLALTLRCVLSQRLLPRADGTGRLLVYELMLANDAIRVHIRENKLHQIASVIQTNLALGMRSMDRMIRDAWHAGEITWETASSAVSDARVLKAG
ncbi:MAG: PilT/PilU family type 4a pilus ATPase [Pseudomonadota bacterium]